MVTENIGIWGPTGCGKTTYLAMLLHRSYSKFRLIPRGTTGEYLSNFYENLTSRGLPVPSTLLQEPRTLSFDVEVQGRFFGQKMIKLSVQDARGDIYELIRHNKDMVDYLAKCTGIMWFIDPDRQIPSLAERRLNENWVSYRKFFFDTLDSLYNAVSETGHIRNGFLPHYMAFCITKIDKYMDEFKADEEAFVAKILGESWKEDIGKYCDPDSERQQRFEFSALGRLKKTRDGYSSPNFDPIQKMLVDPDHIDPQDIEKPLVWMLER